jgi:hypothetical protein
MDAPEANGSTTSWILYIAGVILSPALLYVAHYFLKKFVGDVKKKVDNIEEKMDKNHQEVIGKINKQGAHMVAFEESLRKDVTDNAKTMLSIQKQMQDEIFAIKKSVLNMDTEPNEYVAALKVIVAKLQNHPSVQMEELKKVIEELKNAPAMNEELKGKVIVLSDLAKKHDDALAAHESSLKAARTIMGAHQGRLDAIQGITKKKGPTEHPPCQSI